MLPHEVISAGPVVLRTPETSDADGITRACADPDIARFIPLVPSPYTRDDALLWITELAPGGWEAGGAEFVIAGPGEAELLGVIGLKPVDRLGNGEVGYWVAPWARGRGVATAAVRALSEWAFAHGLPRLALLAGVENIVSQRVAYAAGFEHEGVLRGAQASRDGSRADMVAFARLSTDPGDPIEPFLPFFPGGFPGGSLTDGVVLLTPLTTGDAADRHAVASVPDIVKYHVPPVTPDYAETVARCRYAGHRWLAGQMASIAIRDAETGEYAGDIQLTNIIPPLGQAMIGYSLHPRHRGRGLTTRAVNLLVEWAFENTSLWRIVAGTAPENTASHRVLERAGFTREVLVKDLLPGPGGTRVDDLQWARTR
ncbi:GNAT family N-acetyltransferase [Planotetraspora sp. A-T 1434]|uniref:GNAT family N-acetyltransferase n=1 Tax=Planotetraspora sp. A-T 1434 TaxID=2979219 RepID=UPI0021C0333D|nr:GNAT family N-acetyltransferase [Planotetraspora sp. A-T 1434]MCT9935046.1 GNAT family N-acetyltransferase [Planotetraspora sp. A-T 1434]